MDLIVKKLSSHAKIPTRETSESAGLDLYSAYQYSIPSMGKQLCKTDLQLICPEGTYGRIAPKSGLTRKHFIDVGAGVVDRDYRGNVGVILFNLGTEDFQVQRGQPIAQIIMEKIVIPNVTETLEMMNQTDRNATGFGQDEFL